jgi:hypothetical protein
MSEYAERLAENDINMAVLPDLTDQHLKVSRSWNANILSMCARNTSTGSAHQRAETSIVTTVIRAVTVRVPTVCSCWGRVASATITRSNPSRHDVNYQK